MVYPTNECYDVKKYEYKENSGGNVTHGHTPLGVARPRDDENNKPVLILYICLYNYYLYNV